MDKNTLSNYGWIVIAVLVLSVMIALATPFGEYIKAGVESTTAGLFDTSEKALNVVGMSAKTDATEKAIVKGSFISVNDVAPTQHNLKVNLSSDIITDFSTVNITSTGKNLLDVSKFAIYPNTFTTNLTTDTSNGTLSFMKSGEPNNTSGVTTTVYLPVGEYVLSCNNTNEEQHQSLSVYVATDTTNNYLCSLTSLKSGQVLTITKAQEYNINIFAGIGTEQGTEISLLNLQLECGNTKTAFEPYKEQVLKANTDGTVNGLKSVSPNMTIIADADVEITCEYQKKN